MIRRENKEHTCERVVVAYHRIEHEAAAISQSGCVETVHVGEAGQGL